VQLHALSSPRAEGPSSPHPDVPNSKKANTFGALQLSAVSCSYKRSPDVADTFKEPLLLSPTPPRP
jgi:hypothetical protein